MITALSIRTLDLASTGQEYPGLGSTSFCTLCGLGGAGFGHAISGGCGSFRFR